MRLWSLHPQYLDQKRLCALWREGLLARKVLEGKTKGYKNHPQLIRFKLQEGPVKSIDEYLYWVYFEATNRGYNFNLNKIGKVISHEITMKVTSGQVAFESVHLGRKLNTVLIPDCDVHPIFEIVPGPIEDWERGTL